MHEALFSILSEAAEFSGVKLCEKMNKADLLRDGGSLYCMASVKNAESSPRINARDGLTVGTEHTVTAALRFYGRRCGYSDLADLETAADSFLRYIAADSECLALSAVRSEAERCNETGRLVTVRLIKIRVLSLSREV